MKAAIYILLLTVSANLFATTWDEATINDPISKTETKVWDIMSYGGYIYQWPSKFDGVYWPYTDEHYIRFSSESGYSAFGADFTEITDEEKARVTEFLASNYKKDSPPKTHEELLDWLEQIYRARKASDEFWLTYHSLRAYLSRYDEKTSQTHRTRALGVAEKLNAKLEPGFEKARTLFVLGSYSHMLGRTQKSGEYFQQLTELKWVEEDPEATPSEDVVKYFSSLAEAISSDRYKAEYLPKRETSGEPQR